MLFYSELLHISEDSVTGDDQQTQYVINCAVLPRLHKLLSNDGKGILKEACRAPSNMLETEDFDIRKECAWAISNATSGDNV